MSDQDRMILIHLKSARGGTTTHRVDYQTTVRAFAMWAAGQHGYSLVQTFDVGVEPEPDADGDEVIPDRGMTLEEAIEEYDAPTPFTFWVHPRGGGV